jgi:hypothetical protein
VGPQSCRPIIGAIVRRRPLTISLHNRLVVSLSKSGFPVRSEQSLTYRGLASGGTLTVRPVPPHSTVMQQGAGEVTLRALVVRLERALLRWSAFAVTE